MSKTPNLAEMSAHTQWEGFESWNDTEGTRKDQFEPSIAGDHSQTVSAIQLEDLLHDSQPRICDLQATNFRRKEKRDCVGTFVARTG